MSTNPDDAGLLRDETIEATANGTTKLAKSSVFESVCPAFVHRPPISAFDEVVSIRVGKDDNVESFQCYKGLLGHFSKMFNREFLAPFLESQTAVVELKEDNPRIFRLFYNFISTGRLYETMSCPKFCGVHTNTVQKELFAKLCLTEDVPGDAISALGSVAVPLSFRDLIDLYIFADFRMAPRLQDVAMSLVFEKICTEAYFPVDLIEHLMENTTSGERMDPLVATLVNTVVCFVRADDITKYCDQFPPQFLAQLYRVKDGIVRHLTTRPSGIVATTITYRICRSHRHSKSNGDDQDGLAAKIQNLGASACMERYEEVSERR